MLDPKSSLSSRLQGVVFAALVVGTLQHKHGYVSEFKHMKGHKKKNDYKLPVPHTYINTSNLPKDFNWGNISGVSYLTKNLNQHIPQYCGSCWAHGALSTLADRIKIARSAQGIEINLAIQYLLNCGMDIAGSCHGGSATGAFEFVKTSGFVPFDTCQQYIACSEESTEGFCRSANTRCDNQNVCRTCSTFKSMGGRCAEIDYFPNATIAEYGEVRGELKMMAEIHTRGPIACGIDAEPILDYTGGIMKDDKKQDRNINHIVSVTGWGEDEDGNKYWIVRNSWGEYWGEMGYMRLEKGNNALALESMCSWATPGTWTETNHPCKEDGDNCIRYGAYKDPFWEIIKSNY